MAAACFNIALREILALEGGFVDHPRDPGGCTNLGITLETLRRWRRSRLTNCKDIRALDKAEAAEIYRANYWNKVKGDELQAGVDLMVFDHAVNAGVSRSARLLQQQIIVIADGIIGPKTISAANRANASSLIADLADARINYYKRLRHFPTFGAGWTKRVRHAHSEALKLIAWQESKQ